MNLEELLKELAKWDEMESQDGMNIVEDVEKVNETVEEEGNKLNYLFNVKVSIDAENQTSNAYIKTKILRAIQDILDELDVEVEVTNV